MVETASVTDLVRSFVDEEDGEAMKSAELILNLLEWSPAPFSRHQYTPGHITCTGLVVAPDGERLLLVHHRRLGRWLLPGGHVEPEDATAADAARREVVEETGAALLSAATFIGADVHGIPAKGSEPYHLHHDLVFCFHAAAEELSVSEESHAVVWCAPAEFDSYDVPLNVLRAYRRAVA
ncbi:MAG TPA: NUDIX domain-containing protein [Bryobacteraceae bacterium]|jgi:8-oxo-dGTP pyrophosphatase MutT (NUDIX family)